ncbi:hypothetical protein ACH5RR_003434 [Cinchona calisaya]|uniref:Uncharacterized protein n=1 Tax=Cinchona calisaya TaxID=153742 RepID=A0ABD3AUZ5_9GENT
MAANVAAHLQPQAQAQQQGGPPFPGQFNLTQLTAAHAQAITQASKAQAQAHAQFQAHLQAQGISLNQSHPSGVANLGSASPSISGAGNPSPKRLPQKPPMRPPGFSTASAPSPVRMMELSATAAARKRSRSFPRSNCPKERQQFCLNLLFTLSSLSLSLNMLT